MNGLGDALSDAETLSRELTARPANCRVAVFPPAPLIDRFVQVVKGGPVEVGGQDCHPAPSGAYTGDISAEMLRDAGAHLVILGHSERRSMHHEDDALVALKTLAAIRTGLEPVICVGETLAEREAGLTLKVVTEQLAGSVPDALAGRRFAVAYEPVWAIGSGLTPRIPEIETVHDALRNALEARFPGSSTPILYGGSVNGGNAREILVAHEVDGALVGGASLRAEDFLKIIRAEEG